MIGQLITTEIVPVLLIGPVVGVVILRFSRKAALLAVDLFCTALAASLISARKEPTYAAAWPRHVGKHNRVGGEVMSWRRGARPDSGRRGVALSHLRQQARVPLVSVQAVQVQSRLLGERLQHAESAEVKVPEVECSLQEQAEADSGVRSLATRRLAGSEAPRATRVAGMYQASGVDRRPWSSSTSRASVAPAIQPRRRDADERQEASQHFGELTAHQQDRSGHRENILRNGAAPPHTTRRGG